MLLFVFSLPNRFLLKVNRVFVYLIFLKVGRLFVYKQTRLNALKFTLFTHKKVNFFITCLIC